ncbi:sugar phosphate isomerase/epimerase family protein [Candidatus Palauibacter sp.]|uniref:sugar phosphate isomerase/epimerase family protein n=1 Tax=Candidatus Palauibacter sp. TaxID=3101350 RepID=UPI003AF25525
MNRRRFVEHSLGAGLLLTCAGRAAASGRLLPEAWGLQLYTVRSLMARDVEQTLADVARIGYGEVEFAGYFGRTPAQIRASLDAEGLAAPAVHLSLDELRTGFEAHAEAAAEIGHRYLVLPYLSGPERPGSGGGAEPTAVVDGYRRLADELNRIGERCDQAGLRFAYHNHDFELQAVEVDEEEVRPLDVMLEHTDPDLVRFEVDLFWLVHGGGDPLDYFWRFPGRFELCHVKDRTASGQMVDVGAGVIDFAGIFEREGQAGLLHYFVEHDTPADPLASVSASYGHLASLDG